MFCILRDANKTNTGLVGLWVGPKLVVLLFDPHDIEVVMKMKKNVAKADDYEFLKPWLGDGAIVNSG